MFYLVGGRNIYFRKTKIIFYSYDREYFKILKFLLCQYTSMEISCMTQVLIL